MVFVTTMSDRGQITIPKKIRNKFSSKNLQVTYENETILLRPVNIIPEKKDDLGAFHQLSEKSFGAIWENVEDDIYADFYLKK